jgi:GTP-binding protein
METKEILHSRLPILALVGRPNVGKSTLFNRIVRRRKAVVLDIPGVTRDRNYERVEWSGRIFSVVDTGGYESEPVDAVYDQMREQSLIAIEEADVVIFLTNVDEPGNPVDHDVANILRRSGKPILLAVNKCDGRKTEEESYAFYELGFSDQFAISALNGIGVAELLDRALELLPAFEEEDEDPEIRDAIRIAVIGKQNAGKSTLINTLLGEERVIANPLAGTTRDTIDTTFRANDRVYTIIDTAGIRRRGRIERGIEKLSVLSAQASLERADMAFIMIDAAEGVTEQDEHIAGMAHEAFRPSILVLNKWDLVEKDHTTAGAFAKMLRDKMPYLAYAPIVTLSAKTQQRVSRLLPMVDTVYEEWTREISTKVLNEWLEDSLRRFPPPLLRGKQLRLKYVVQTGTRPPTFTFFVNNPMLLHFSYERYLINRLRETFGFEGVPISIRTRRKSRRLNEVVEENPEE